MIDLGHAVDAATLLADLNKTSNLRVVAPSGLSLFNPPAATRYVGKITIRDGTYRHVVLSDEMPQSLSASLAEQLKQVRLTFDLPTAWVAKILRVKRQTVYLWSEGAGSVSVSPRESNLQRLDGLLRLGLKWRTLSNVRFNRKHAMHIFDHKPLLEWLEKSELSDPKLDAMLSSVAENGLPHPLVKPLNDRIYRGPAHPLAHRERLLERSLVGEPKG